MVPAGGSNESALSADTTTYIATPPFNFRYGQTRSHRGISKSTDPMPMNEQNPGAAPIESTPLTMPYKDRSAGLITFGILTILLGCLAGLFVLLILFGQAASAKVTGTPATFSAILPAISIYGVLAVALV